MTINAIAPLGAELIPALGNDGIAPLGAKNAAASAGFTQWMSEQIGEVSGQINSADTQLRQLAVGETGNLHQVLLDLEKARLAFQLTVQVRNKVLEGYQEIMRMQI